MGQIVSAAAKPKRCNANQLSQVPTPAAGDYILVSSDNSMNAAGQGYFDSYIIGDGTKAAAALELRKFKAEELDIQINGGLVQKVITPADKKDGVYVINTNTMLVYFRTDTAYYTSDPIDVSELAGNPISVKASVVGSQGAFLCNASMIAIDYVCGTNAASKGYTTSSTPQVVTFNNTEGAKYLVTDIRNALYTGISDFAVTGLALSEGLEDRVSVLERDKVTDYVKKLRVYSKNLFNPETAESGFIQNENGTIVASESYITSDFIAVKANVPITISPQARKLLAFDENKSAITSSYINAVITNYTFTPSVDGFVRISFFTSDTEQQVEVGSSVTSYEPYWEKDVIESDVHLSDAMEQDVADMLPNNILKGKKWVHCGDSFSDYTNKNFESGTFAGKNKTYPRLIAERCGMELNETFFLSGRTLAYPADGSFTNSLTCPSAACYYQNIPADADYITIQLGINDLNHADGTGTTPDGEDATGVIELGTITDTVTSTYYGAWNNVLTWLRNNRPFAHVGIIVTNGLGWSSDAYHDAQINVAKKYGYPYIDLNGDQHTPIMNRFNNHSVDYSLYALLNEKMGVSNPTNTHPNWQAHEYESTFIEAWLKSI